MSCCNKCGGTIEFRHVNGRITPLHTNGGCGGASAFPATPKTGVSLGEKITRGFTYQSFVNPNAHCPQCHAPVFFYQSPYGGRVYFDELGPPWPKHQCINNEKFLVQGAYHWQTNDWKPFFCTNIIESNGFIEVRGLLDLHSTRLTLFVQNTGLTIKDLPLLIKSIEKQQGHYLLATFTLEQDEQWGTQARPVTIAAFDDVFKLAQSKRSTDKIRNNSRNPIPRIIRSKSSTLPAQGQVGQKKKDHTSPNPRTRHPTETAFLVAWRKALNQAK